MDCKDLMIGDWVYDTMRQENKKVTRMDFERNPMNGVYYAETLLPIPITSDILEKNGFSEIHHPGTGATDEYSEWFLGGIKITEWLEDWKDHHFSTGGDDCSISFNYVHQLQHLLRLCGIEKSIIL